MDLSFIDKKIDDLQNQRMQVAVRYTDRLLKANKPDEDKVLSEYVTEDLKLKTEIEALQKEKDDLIERHYRVQCEIYREYPSNDE